MRHRRCKKEGCTNEELGGEGGKSRVPSFTALCINYWTTPLYTHPTWSPSPEWSQTHELVSFQNVSKRCLFQHLLKYETESPAVITKASGISMIILITGAWLKRCYVNHKRPRPQLDYELLYSLMLRSTACTSSVDRKLEKKLREVSSKRSKWKLWHAQGSGP